MKDLLVCYRYMCRFIYIYITFIKSTLALKLICIIKVITPMKTSIA